ncbi:MAG TPA: VacJ family lipoprotein [Burkholderiales bacterium]|nr:VacJ family lipoprotein [Burkholderiales bacterium]
MKGGTRILLLALLLSGAAGCATTAADPRDPFEGFNRAMYSFNDGFDEAIGKPLATGYRDALDPHVRSWVRNFFANIADLMIGVNDLLQGKPYDTFTDWARFAFNTTVGVFGINDVATDMGIEKHDEDFGQTFGRWGMGDGPYLVWPFLGSSSVRDSAGTVLDVYTDPVARHKPSGVAYAGVALRTLGKRADLLDASRILEEAALDKYVFQRDAYLQRRRNQVYDGNPPRAQREAPKAEIEIPGSETNGPGAQLSTEPAAQSSAPALPALLPTPEATVSSRQGPGMDAAVQLLEQPAALPATSGS